MAYSKEKIKSNGDNGSPYAKPFSIGNMSEKCLPTRTMLQDSFIHIFIWLTSAMGIPNAMKIVYNISILTETYSLLKSYLRHCFIFITTFSSSI